MFEKIISYIFHPLLMPSLGTFLLFNSGTYLSFVVVEAQIPIYIIVGICTFLLPILSIPILIYGKYIQSIYIRKNNERIIPLTLSVIFYYIGYNIVANIAIKHFVFNSVKSLLLGSLASIMITLIITIKWKISAHMVGVGGIIGLLFAISLGFNISMLLPISIMFLLSGIVAYSRLKLNEHSPAQVYFGFLLGFISIFVTFIIA